MWHTPKISCDPPIFILFPRATGVASVELTFTLFVKRTMLMCGYHKFISKRHVSCLRFCRKYDKLVGNVLSGKEFNTMSKASTNRVV